MKKMLILLMLFLSTMPAYSNIEYFNLGKNSYNLGLYGEAKEYLSLAVKAKPKNKTYRYYYAQSLLQLGMVEEAAEQYQAIVLSAPNSAEGMASSRVLTTINKYFENKAGDFKLPDVEKENYIPYVLLENPTIRRWDKQQLNVFVQPDISADIIQKAFFVWSDKTSGILTFNFVPSRENADITVKFVDKMPVVSPETGYINGFASVKYLEKNISKVDITIQNRDSKTKEAINPDEIFKVALHEIGHAIGISGHSDNPSDIMYSEMTETNPTLSARDVNTAKIIYNFTTENIAELGDNPINHSIKLNKAKEYVNAYPNLDHAWSELAAAYVATGDYAKAIESIKKAIEIKGEDALLYTQLAGYYAKTNDIDNAISTYKLAYDLDTNNKVYLYNWAKICYKNKRAEEAREEVDKYLMGQGFLANDEISRSLRRMYKIDKEKEKEKIKINREAKEKKLEELQEQEEFNMYPNN